MKLSGLIAGIRMGLQQSPFIPSFKKTAYLSVRSAGKEVERLSETIGERGKACAEAKDIYSKTFEAFKLYAKTHPSSIGTDIHLDRKEKCAIWLKGYYQWLSDILISESEEIKAEPIIDLPDITLPVMPKLPLSGVGSDIKKSLQVTGMVVMLFVALIVYLMFVRGGAGREVRVG